MINGFVIFLPFCNSHFQEAPTSAGWTAWLGATIFEFGSVFGILEAWNRADVADFGWAVNMTLHHQGGGEMNGDEETSGNQSEFDSKGKKPVHRWMWISTDGKYWHEIGFLAAFAQLCAATIFWISG